MKGISVHILHLLSLRKKHIEGRMITVFLVFCPNTKLFFHFIPRMYNFKVIQKFTSLWEKKEHFFAWKCIAFQRENSQGNEYILFLPHSKKRYILEEVYSNNSVQTPLICSYKYRRIFTQ